MRTLYVAGHALILSVLLPASGMAQQRVAPAEGPSAAAVQPAAGSAPQGDSKMASDGAHGPSLKQEPLPATNGAQSPAVRPGAGTPLQSGPASAGAGARKALTPPGVPGKGAWPGGSPADHNPKSDSTTTDNTAESGVTSLMRPHSHPGTGRSLIAPPLKKKDSNPALGDYTKKNQRHPAEKVAEARGEKVKRAKAENHASVPGESLKEQESRLHRMANPQESATEQHTVAEHPTPPSHALAGNFAARGQALVPTPGHHSPNPAIVGGGAITSRTQGAAVIGGSSMAGAH